jgi:CTP:molybdopterin cytidylyltransferase MocA
VQGLDDRLAAIVLAAGHGRRMGIPKALLVIDGKTLAEHHVARLVELGCAPVIIVVRPEIAGALRPRLERFRSVSVVTARTGSQAESLVAGARALDSLIRAGGGEEAPRSILVSPVDMMPPSRAVVRALRAALVLPLLAVTPTYRGRGGHPIVVRPEVLTPLVRAAGQGSPGHRLSSLREVLERLGPRRARIEIGDPGVLDDLDVPSDVQAVAGALPARS